MLMLEAYPLALLINWAQFDLKGSRVDFCKVNASQIHVLVWFLLVNVGNGERTPWESRAGLE